MISIFDIVKMREKLLASINTLELKTLPVKIGSLQHIARHWCQSGLTRYALVMPIGNIKLGYY